MTCIKCLKSGAKIETLTEEEQKAMNYHYNRKHVNYVRVQPDGFIIMDTYIEFADRYIDFKFNNEDILIMGFPKSGTTWTQEIIWTMIHNPNLDRNEGIEGIYDRAPFFEHDATLKMACMPPIAPGNKYYDAFVKAFPEKDPNNGLRLQTMEEMKGPRMLKTHLLFSILPQNILDTSKVVYIARNPKDVLVSLWHHLRLMKNYSYTGSLSQLMEHFLKGLVPCGPYWQAVKGAWKRRDHPNLHFLFYEDLKENQKQEFTALQNFLGLHLTEEQIDGIIQYTKFDIMKERETPKFNFVNSWHSEIKEAEGGFFRKGIARDSRNILREEEMTKMDEWISENTKDLDLEFIYKKSV